jgi:hypothetical protein
MIATHDPEGSTLIQLVLTGQFYSGLFSTVIFFSAHVLFKNVHAWLFFVVVRNVSGKKDEDICLFYSESQLMQTRAI